MRVFSLASLTTSLALSAAQNVTVPTTCTGEYSAGRDEVLYTVPYTYDQVLSIIGNYSNLTWSGSPPGSVSLNGTENTVGTARTYDLAGAHVIETILVYSKPPAPGPYYEVHNTATLEVASANLSAYIPYDATTVTSVCDGKASMFNFTAGFCATNVTSGAALLHMLHMQDAVTVGKFLGGMNYTSCAALGASNSTGAGSASGTMGGAPAQYTGASAKYEPCGMLLSLLLPVIAFLL